MLDYIYSPFLYNYRTHFISYNTAEYYMQKLSKLFYDYNINKRRKSMKVKAVFLQNNVYLHVEHS